jgi:C4-dicarboxylate-specific signal transduction histidine kinase
MGMVLLGAACFRMGTGLATAAFALLIVVTLMSLLGNFAVSVALSVMAVLCLSFFFADPIFSVRVANTVDVSALLAFLTTSIVITGLSVRVRRLAERKLAQSRADLARFARVASLGELTASIAHEVNQPLAGVVSSGDACQRWLAGEPPNLARAMQSLDRIIRDAHRASQVVERIRNLAKNAPPQKASVNLNEAVLEIIGLASDEIEQGRISLKTQLGEDVPPVWADRIQLQQVMLNLIINAIEAVGEIDGPRQLSVGTERAHGSGVLLSVRDSGKGLDAEQAEHIFDPFYTTKPEGMGMGLAVSRGIIEAHGGRLWATWNEPPGTVFRFTLPTEARS